jgi:hypothetical protein
MPARVLRQVPFVFDGGTYHLPRPTSAGAGRARHEWFKRWPDAGPVRIASRETWAQLTETQRPRVLQEYADGTYGVVHD